MIIATILLALLPARFDSGPILVPQHHYGYGAIDLGVKLPVAPPGMHAVVHMTTHVDFAVYVENTAPEPCAAYQWATGLFFNTGNQVCGTLCGGSLAPSNGVYDGPSCSFPTYCEGFEQGSDHHVIVCAIDQALAPMPTLATALTVDLYAAGLQSWNGAATYGTEPTWLAFPLYYVVSVRGYVTFE